jgi:carbon monoxide dehydrogenase subunit G
MRGTVRGFGVRAVAGCRVAAALAGLFVLSPGVARAGDDDAPKTDAEGYVTSNIEVNAPIDSVRAYLSEPSNAVNLAPGTKLVSETAKGACDELTVQTPGVTSNFEYVSIRCPTPTGWVEKLVRSDQIASNDVEWRLAEHGSGTTVTLRVKTAVHWVPASLIESRVASSITTTLARLKAKLTGH